MSVIFCHSLCRLSIKFSPIKKETFNIFRHCLHQRNEHFLPRWSGQDGHQGALTCMACNKDGSLVLTGSVDGCAKLINAATGKVGAMTTTRHSSGLTSVSVRVFVRWSECFPWKEAKPKRPEMRSRNPTRSSLSASATCEIISRQAKLSVLFQSPTSWQRWRLIT